MFTAALLPRLAGRLLGLGALVVAGSLAAGTAGAVTAPMLVVDVDSGKVLYSQGATDPWYPASITKLMTTYVALDMVRQGRASMDQLLTISEAAAAEPPSKMGFRPGTQLTLDNALKIIMVKSANDVAWAIGENLGGSIEGFADRMNETAQRLGMRDSHWYNPNGLPDPRQWTSARDMAVLGRALLRDFPENRDLFSISAIQFGRAVMPNHNGLLGRYAGVDGMKTGFICSGGFNVVASANRNGRRILTVVMGQASARERDLKAADLFDYGFGQSTFGWGGQTLNELPTSSIASPPDMRPYICDKRRPMPTDSDSSAVTAGAGAGGNADNANAQLMAVGAQPSSALAFATMNSAALRNRALPPRAPLQPVLVWTGRDPAESTIAATDEAAPAKPVTPRVKVAKPAPHKPAPSRSIAATGATVPQPKLLARKKGAAPASASAFASTGPATSVIAEPKAAHKAAVKPAAKPAAKDAKPVKPEAKAAAKPTVKSARKKDD
ncbi:D-alanyl-D-alanine carboxypeptidase family protein [Methylobacterium sp. Gmos1]